MREKIDINSVFAVSGKVVPRRIKDKLIIVPIEDGVADFNDVMFSFNDTGTRIWEGIEQGRSLKAICDTLVEQYDADPERIRGGVENLVQAMLEKGIIEKWQS